MPRAFFSLSVAFLCGAAALTMAAPVTHPNLLLNQAEIEQVKAKIQRYPWAAQLFEKVKQLADAKDGCVQPFQDIRQNIREQALCYVLTGDRTYADKVRRALLGQARNELPKYEPTDPKADPHYGYTGWQNAYDADAWAYDLTWDTFSEAERETVEQWLRAVAKAIVAGTEFNGTTPNLMFVMHFSPGLIGYCLGDQELIDWALKDPGLFGPHCGGFYPVMDSMIRDKLFWGEAPLYLLDVDLHGMFALAEAARHYGKDDLYRYVSPKSGASLKGLLDGYLRTGFPMEHTGDPASALRMASFGDGSTSYSPQGIMRDLYLTCGQILTPLEIGYARFRDPGYAWVLSLNPERTAETFRQRAGVWGYLALTHGEPLPAKPTPPQAPCGVYPDQGFAMLRADESPSYWTGDGLAAFLRLDAAIGHGHADYYGLVLHGKGRLLYPDEQFWGYEPTWLGWSRAGIGHNTLLVDFQSPRPKPAAVASKQALPPPVDFPAPQPGATATWQDFTPEVKFVAVSGSAFAGILQTRRLLMTQDYLADIFHAAGPAGETHTYDWVLHGLGRLYPGNPGAYRPTHDLLAQYWWVEHEQGRSVDDTWQADWIQRSAGIVPGRQFGPEWFNHEVGVRLTMLGVAGTRTCYGDGPLVCGPPYGLIEGNPEGSVPLIVVRREAAATTFAAVHEAYEGAPRIRQVRRLAETSDAVALVITASNFTDYVMTAFDPQPHTLATAAGEVFTFADYGYLRVAGDRIVARGKLTALRLSAQTAGGAKAITLNGRKESLHHEGAFFQWGKLPAESTAGPAAVEAESPAERAAALHYYWLPEEIHLSATNAADEREVALHLRAVGAGEVQGALSVSARAGVNVEPARIEIAPLREGEERVVRLKVRATEKAETGLCPISLAPAGDLRAPRQTLLASVGVVIAVDRRIPGKMQHVVRAPGYTIKIDDHSGVAGYLLDADGNRRYGWVYSGLGFPKVGPLQYDGTSCSDVWPGQSNTLTIVADPRIRYAFEEDRIHIALVSAGATNLLTMALGAFDELGAPVHNGKQAQPWSPIVADRFFFPHSLFRQGVLLTTPPQTPLMHRGASVDFPIPVGQEITLQFATPEAAGPVK